MADISLFKKPCVFMLGAMSFKQFPKLDLAEVAFFGRSNSGKSSLINRLVYQKKLVKTSNTPGKTKEINFFNLYSKLLLVDLPGYGFSKVDDKLKKKWQNLVFNYLKERQSLKQVYLIIDIRRGIKDIDEEVMNFLESNLKSYSIVLNKIDKISEKEAESTLKLTQEQLANKLFCKGIYLLSIKDNEDGYNFLRKELLSFINI
jgi:GTP-binding protein